MNMLNLHIANVARQKEWDPGKDISFSFRANELAGEAGEACNIIKKLERERLGIRGSRATLQELSDELADIIICVDLIAMHIGSIVDSGDKLVWLKNRSLSSLGANMMVSVGMICHIVESTDQSQLVSMLGILVQRTELIASSQKIDLDAAVCNKFNATSEKYNLTTRMK